MLSTTLYQTWLASAVLCSGSYAQDIISLPDMGSTASPDGNAPACNSSDPPDVFIARPQGSKLFFEPTWNATIGGFEMIAAATAPLASQFYSNSVCDDSIDGPSNPQCGIPQLAFNYYCAEDETTTTYMAWVYAEQSPITFFDAQAEADGKLNEWYRVTTFGPGCQLSLYAYDNHDESSIAVIKDTLWMGSYGLPGAQVFLYPPIHTGPE